MGGREGIVCLHVQVCMRVCIRVCAQKSTYRVFFNPSLSCFLRYGLSLSLKPINCARMVVRRASGISCLCLLPRAKIKEMHYHILLFTSVPGIQTQALMLLQQALYQLAVSPVPVIINFMSQFGKATMASSLVKHYRWSSIYNGLAYNLSTLNSGSGSFPRLMVGGPSSLETRGTSSELQIPVGHDHQGEQPRLHSTLCCQARMTDGARVLNSFSTYAAFNLR